MRRMARKYELDMTHGSLIPKIMAFALPLMVTSMLQLLYNAADVIVVGRFAGSQSLAAVGSTSSLINLIVNIFLGLSVGTNVVAANHYGAGDFRATQETVHTSVGISLAGGVALGIFGFIFGGTFLSWMGSPEDVLPLATTYIRIYFLGMPFNMLYNFGAALLRAIGDTVRPLAFLSLSGVVNVVLNLVLVIVFDMGVAGVAWATIISQAVSAILVLLCLIHSSGFVHLDMKKIKIHRDSLAAMLKIGLPAGLQSACFSLSNVLIQSTVNSFGSTVMAGNSAAQNIEGFVYVGMNAFHQAAVTFTSANVGAKKNSRIRSCLFSCLLLVTAVGVGLDMVILLLGKALLGIYSTDAQVIAAGYIRLYMFGYTYFLCGIMEVVCGVLRGMGASIAPMIVSVLGACVFRIFWVYVILPINPTLNMLYLSYPVSWVLTSAAHLVSCLIVLKKFPVEKETETPIV